MDIAPDTNLILAAAAKGYAERRALVIWLSVVAGILALAAALLGVLIVRSALPEYIASTRLVGIWTSDYQYRDSDDKYITVSNVFWVFRPDGTWTMYVEDGQGSRGAWDLCENQDGEPCYALLADHWSFSALEISFSEATYFATFAISPAHPTSSTAWLLHKISNDPGFDHSVGPVETGPVSDGTSFEHYPHDGKDFFFPELRGSVMEP